MEQILNKYKDENGFVKNIVKLYKELLKNNISVDESLKIISSTYMNNINIKRKFINIYKEERKILENHNKEKTYLNYNEEQVITMQEHKITYSNNEPIDFYIQFIENNLENGNFIDILPKQLNKDSLIIFAKILNYYKKDINFIKCLISIETSSKELDLLLEQLSIKDYIYKKILSYKESLKNLSDEDINIFKNNLIFFMNGNEPYIYYDIIDNKEIYPSIKKLLESIQKGTFKNLSKFRDYNDLLEVRDISNQTRIIFERRDKSYCIIGAITKKAETNKYYREKINNRFKTYQNNKNNISSLNNITSLKKILEGEQNE